MSNSRAVIAQAIFESSAIRFGDFTLASGIKSPYYIDLSRLLASPRSLKTFLKTAGEEIRAKCDGANIDALASIELRGALLLSALAPHLDRPCFVVRKTEKSYGITGKIVGGEIKPGQHLMLFDDVITDGGSKLDPIHILEDAGAKVQLVLVVVDREQGGSRNLGTRGYPLESLLTTRQLVSELSESRLIDPEIARAVTGYLENETKNTLGNASATP